MDYRGLVKRLSVPPDFVPPRLLEHDGLTARAITRDHVEADVRGINESLELIRATRGGEWPSEPVTVEYNYVDLVWHELEFRELSSFTYTVWDANDAYLGCCYLYPVGSRTPLSAELLTNDVDVSWWVTPEAYERGLYATLYEALQVWVVRDYPFRNPHYSNVQLPIG
jgi:hypothetical protein